MYRIRSACQGDMAFILELAAKEGWNPGLSDQTCFYQADPEGFFIGELSGRPIGCVSAVSYGGFGFLGLYIVAEPYRGQGYGLALWQRAMDRLAGKNIGLDGVVAQQENYKKSGFRLAHRNLRYQGIIPAGPGLPPDIAAGESQAFPALLAYDTRHFPEPRQTFLAAWLSAPEHRSLVCRRDGQVRGYGVIRRCLQGYKIGPLFADDSEIAQGLFQGLAALADQEPVFLDISETNKEALALCQAQGMTAQFETARMYTGPAPDLPWDQVYGITTFELG